MKHISLFPWLNFVLHCYRKHSPKLHNFIFPLMTSGISIPNSTNRSSICRIVMMWPPFIFHFPPLSVVENMHSSPMARKSSWPMPIEMNISVKLSNSKCNFQYPINWILFVKDFVLSSPIFNSPLGKSIIFIESSFPILPLTGMLSKELPSILSIHPRALILNHFGKLWNHFLMKKADSFYNLCLVLLHHHLLDLINFSPSFLFVELDTIPPVFRRPVLALTFSSYLDIQKSMAQLISKLSNQSSSLQFRTVLVLLFLKHFGSSYFHFSI